MKIKMSFLMACICAAFVTKAGASDYINESTSTQPTQYISMDEATKEIENLLNYATVNQTSYQSNMDTFFVYYNCPFETVNECEIWRTKPAVNETTFVYDGDLTDPQIYEIMDYISCNPEITGNNIMAKPLVDRYKMLMNAANACCTDGMVYQLKTSGADEDLIYTFLINDTNFYNIGDRCLFMNDDELDDRAENTQTAEVIADVRNGCLCNAKEMYKSMLEPFYILYYMMPDFRYYPFAYTYTDGLKRDNTVSINQDIQKVMVQLQNCP